MAFHGLSGTGAEQLLFGDYGSVVAGVSANAAGAVARSGRVVRYLGDYAAVVRGAHGLRIERSTTPLEVGDGVGKRPVDLALRAAGSVFVPTAPVAGVSIARDSAGGVAVGSSGLRVTLEGASVAGKQAAGQSVFFGSVGVDMDASVASTINGAELFAVLRSRLSPEQIRYRVALPAGATLEEHAGGAVVSRAGDVLARVMAPDARDAQGSGVPVSMRVSGDDLLLSVSHRDRDIAYPVLVDPTITVPLESNKGWTFTGSEGIGWSSSLLSIAAETILPSGEVNSGKAFWATEVPKTLNLSTVEFLGMTGFTKSEVIEGFSGSVGWQILACNESFGTDTSAESMLPSSMSFSYSGSGSCAGTPLFRIELAVFGAPPHEVREAGAISVGSILVTYTPSATEEEELEFEGFGEGSKGVPNRKPCLKGHPVNCATGNQVETQNDLSIGGRGPGLHLTRTYNSRAASVQSRIGASGSFGYGWTGTDSAHLTFPSACFRTGGSGALCEKTGVDVYEDDGSALFFEGKSGGPYTAADPLAQATLVKEASNYVYTLPNQTKLTFNEAGQLTSQTDRDGNATTVKRNAEGLIESVSDAAGRKLTYAYNASKEVESVTDQMGHTVKYEYESGNLIGVTQPGEISKRWKFKYNAAHEMTEMTDGRGNTITTEYNEAHQVVSQTDAMLRKRSWKYATIEGGTETTITEPNSSTTVEKFNKLGLPTSVIRASGTAIAATTTYEYNGSDELIAVTDPNKHTIKYGYDAAGNRTSVKDANENETKWKYDSTHDVETMTTPKGEVTTIKREAHGNPEVIERPAPESKTQKTTYKYNEKGDLTEETDPLEHKTKFEVDTYGDRKSETDPEGNKRTWEYNEDSQETSTVSPRGNITGGKPAEFTTKIERDAQGRPIKITDPLAHTTKYTYDGDGNRETVTDGNSHTTTYTYDADNEQTKVEAPNKAITETGFDAAGQVTSQTDGNKHITKYVRNLLEEVTEVEDPLGHKTTKEYDLAGNLTKLTDPKSRTTTYTYDAGNRLKEVVYSSGKPATIKYEYDKDGDRTGITDGTGTSKYTFDQLDRLTETETGHKEKTKYEYDLANDKTKITYPNTKAVTRAFDKDDRLEKVTDWSSNITKFTYDQDSDLATIVFPTASKDEDKYAYNDADQMTEAKMLKSTESLASLVYTRDGDGQVKTTTSKGLPGEEKPATEYDANNRLTKGATVAYEYDAANNATKIGTGTYKYNAASQLETGPSLTYTYDELGERTKTTPTTGPATTYGYDQAENLTSAERPKEGATPEIKDTYAYDGNGLRASQTISGTTTYLVWDMTEGLPLVLSDTTNSYIYGPNGLPIEQISSGGTITYLHHDQQGSTRLLTGSTGTVTGKCTYGAYGAPTCEGASTTPLGYDAQYTSTDTGLIYMRARTYDPATAQFLTVDPINPLTRAPYNYANDNPVNYMDRTGLCSIVPGAPENCFSEVPGAIVSGVESVAQNPVEAGGIILGGVAVGTGVAEVAGAGAAGGGAVSALGATSAASGAAATGLDLYGCAGGSGVGCVGAGLGAVASGGAGAVLGGFLGGEAASGATAIGVPSSILGFITDIAGALAPSSAPAAGCGGAGRGF
jgi:RHS repeat-associated protein